MNGKKRDALIGGIGGILGVIIEMLRNMFIN